MRPRVPPDQQDRRRDYRRTHSSPAAPAPKPSTFGGAADAGVFAGRGVMVGSNPDVWKETARLARDGFVDVVAVTPNTPYSFLPARTVVWHPPQHDGPAHILQAESQAEWNAIQAHGHLAVAINARDYGRLDGKVALVEAYYNEGQGVDFNYFNGYADLGAKAVIPLCGGYSAPGRSDALAGEIYMQLAGWATGRMPGLWMYAGESMLTAESIAALKAWRP